MLLHFTTKKGKGLPEAEENPTKYHQLSPENEPKGRTWSEAASEIAEEIARKDERIVCLTAAMATGVKLEHFAHDFPKRFFECLFNHIFSSSTITVNGYPVRISEHC